ncbi:hypothetical protein ES288_A06G149500v1 [Gossypium darwinii]|uniref:Dof zinc finger protein n=1 Tax=Gossypium darwinii TaxID=34276 RepID=A0A5D2G7J1_GOSDA|nr:hypothetical protein ES288_A06G149500v1 [Gossypium darwinii]
MMMASTSKLMEKPSQQAQALKCPRCDSSNTKFCYYNNYSLSQPRHFCKACKRYWTKGGTLRNVPVGGGCRKNKRLKRPASAIAGATASPSPRLQIDVSSPSTPPININPLFYGLAADTNLPFPNCSDSRVSSGVETVTNYDLQPPQLNAFRPGFSSATAIVSSDSGDGDYGNASALHQHKFIDGGLGNTQPPTHFQALPPFRDLHMTDDIGAAIKDVKVEEPQRRMEWNVVQAQLEQIGSYDPVTAWHD